MTDKTPNKIQAIQTNMLKEQIETIRGQFEQLDRLDVRTIPENIFVHHFLPVFSGEKTENVQEALAMWVNIAGSNFHSVNVVNPQGEVVAQVPPLQNNNALDPSKKHTNLAYTLKEAQVKSELSPMAAQSLLSNQLIGKLDNMTQDIAEKNKPLEQRWTDLLAKYGKASKADEKRSDTDTEGDPFGF